MRYAIIVEVLSLLPKIRLATMGLGEPTVELEVLAVVLAIVLGKRSCY